jgi:phosphoenolpyruvate-protein phosphotransferase (PTS system enzyme I)
VDPKVEAKLLEDALSRSLSDLAALRARMEPTMSESYLRVFEGRRMILEDEEFVGRIRDKIANGYTAENALLRVIDELSSMMLTVLDTDLRERATDFRDIGDGVLRNLRSGRKPGD